MIDSTIQQAPITKEFIKEHLPDNPVIIEAGAHIGRDTVKMSKVWPAGTIYAFEPVPALYEQLAERTKDLPNVKCFPIALSSQIGTARFNVSSGASTAASSLLEPKEYLEQRPNVIFTPISIETTTLDQWAYDNGVISVDFMWLDMQGHELAVIEASTRIFPTVKAVLIEASLTERFKGNPLYSEVIEWFIKRGFRAIRQDEPKHNKINIFFVRYDY